MMNVSTRTNDDDDCMTRQGPALDPKLSQQSDRVFSSFRADAYRHVRLREKDILAMPWGPVIDVVFDPKGAMGIVGGLVRIMARTAGTEVEVAAATITSADQPLSLHAACGCDEYVVKASLGADPGPNARRTESYFFARVYAHD